MPTGNKYIITPVIRLAEQIQPKSILDIGVGFGKWGFLLREYLEIWRWDNKLYEEDQKFNWSVAIDGVEICGEYIKELQRNIYDNIYVDDICNLFGKLQKYDLIILGDVIEHFEKDKGITLLDKCFDKANKAVIVMTPIAYFPQGAAFNNTAEKHKSLWTKEDFEKYGAAQLSYIRGSLIVVLSKMNKKFQFENRYKLLGYLNRYVAHLQLRNIKKYGIDNFDRGFLMRMYSAVQKYRENELQKINS